MATVVGTYAIDAAVTETVKYAADVTDHPVEQGSNVADNVRVKPVEIELECIVSDVPVGAIATVRANELANSASAVTPSVDAYYQLSTIFEARQPVVVQCKRGTFADMVMYALTVPATADDGASLRFTASFKQVTVVTTQVARVSVPSAAAKQQLGHQPAQSVLYNPTTQRYDNKTPGFASKANPQLKDP